MNKLRRFFVQYMMVPVLMCALTAVFSIYHAAGEVDSLGYATLTTAWPELHQPARKAISDAIASGKISRWNYQSLFTIALNDTHGLAMPVPSQLGTTAEERQKLIDAVRGAGGTTVKSANS
jgi:hypothetical protein